MNWKTLLPTIVASAMGLIGTLSPDAAQAVTVFVEHNPSLSMWLVAVLWIVHHLLPSPIQNQIDASTPPPLH